MADLKFVPHLPEHRASQRGRWDRIIAEMKARPNEWALVESGPRYAHPPVKIYALKETFEVRRMTRTVKGVKVRETYIRFIGGSEAL